MGRSLARATYRLRRALSERFGLLVAAAAAALLAVGFFAQVAWNRGSLRELLLVGAIWGAWLIRATVGRPAQRAELVAQVDRLESGLLLLCSIYVAIQLTGGPDSWLQPGAYLAVAYLVGFNGRAVAALLVLAALGLQLGLHLAAGDLPGQGLLVVQRCGFIAAFGLANLVLMQVEVLRRRRDHHQRLAAEIQSMRDEARDYRLIASALSIAGTSSRDRALVEAKLARGAVEAIHQGLFFTLELLKRALDLQTCVLLWLDERNQRLRIKELVTDSNMVTETAIAAQAGALGGVVKNRLLLNLRSPRAGSGGVAYYAGPEEVGAFVGVPVLEEGHIRGVLCADRRQQHAFSEAEEKLLVDASAQVLRAIQTERVFASVERSKYEQERFYRASTMLNGALTLAQVYETAFAAAREIVEFDLGALTLYDRARRTHTICRVLGDPQQVEALEGQSFGDNAGLVAMVVKNKHFLPADGALVGREMLVFTRRLRLGGAARSLVVLPLIVQDSAIGTFVLGCREQGRLPKQTREMLGVISNQIAVSIENAKMYKLMEEMATTDGLTGLPNHRTFQSRLSEMLYRAERHGKPVAVVLTDVDKFKSINDTYGHPIGDLVLKRLALVLADEVRKVDLVARYGGEEFVMILEETDSDGARLLCERVRQQVAAQVMSSDQGSFRVTISLGIACYPEDGTEKAELVERADQALYHAKETGRNRTVCWSALQKRKKSTACG